MNLKYTNIKKIHLVLLILSIFSVVYSQANQNISAVGIGKTQDDYGPVYFRSENQTKEEMLQDAMETSLEIEREGIVLLENRNNSLPFSKNEEVDIIRFETYSGEVIKNQWIDAGGGSSGPMNQPLSQFKNNFFSSLKDVGLDVTTLNKNTLNYSDRPASVKDRSIMITISRSASEDGDRMMYIDEHSHELRLSQEEVDCLIYAVNHYDNVVMIMNVATQFEMGFLHDPESYFDPETGIMPMGKSGGLAEDMQPSDLANLKAHLNSAIVTGYPGDSGGLAIAEVLAGKVNPSGKLTSTWYNDFTKDPTYQNFADFTKGADGNQSNIVGGNYVHYDEDIYVGYRYYETRGYTDGNAWYEANMNYPIGHGLSYTNFEYELKSSTIPNNSTLKKDDTISVDVKVTNTGDVAGKEVVFLYYNAPYYKGGISKAHVILAGYEKTKMLQPGKSDTITISYKVEDMKSYDWNDKNNNGIKGYELEDGEYNVYVSSNSHSWYDIENGNIDKVNKLTYNVDSNETTTGGFYYKNDTTTNTEVGNIFDDVSLGNTLKDHYEGASTNLGVQQYFSRDDWSGTFPTSGLTKKNLGDQTKQPIPEEWYNQEDMPWYREESEKPTQAETAGTLDTNEIKIWHMMGRSYDDPLWDVLLDQLTIEEMINFIDSGFGKTKELLSIGKKQTYDEDGPMGWTKSKYGELPSYMDETYYTFKYTSGTVVAQTFNRELIYERGKMQGMEGTLGNIHSTTYNTYSGIYAPGANLHRNPFCGRNFEYFSEDPVISGITSAYMIDGLQDQGVYCYYKHFFLNEQETNRNELTVWASEQAMREIYAKGFEIGVKLGKPTGIMTSFSDLGTTLTPESYAAVTQLLRNEWGFEGTVLTDWKPSIDAAAGIRAGCDLVLDYESKAHPQLMSESHTSTFVNALRDSVHNVLYTVASSNAMNGATGDRLYSLSNGGVTKTTYIGDNFNSSIAGFAYNRSGTEYTYHLEEGTVLPEGLTLLEDGSIVGCPTTSGIYTFKVRAKEKDMMTQGRQTLFFPYTDVVETFEVNILNGKPIGLTFNDSTIHKDLNVGETLNRSVAFASYYDTDGIQQSDGITYKVAEGSALVEGLTLTTDGNIVGTTPNMVGDHSVDVVATHPTYGSVTSTIYYKIAAIIINFEKVDLSDDYYVGEKLVYELGGATGSDDITYSIDNSTNLPVGLSLDNKTGTITGTCDKAYNNYKVIIWAKAFGAISVSVEYDLTIKGITQEDITKTVQLDRGFKIVLDSKLNYDRDEQMYYEVLGDLPEGVYLSTNGTLVGKIDNIGTYNIDIKISCKDHKSIFTSVTIVVVNVDTYN